MRACGWAVLDVEDGNYDVQAIVAALLHAQHLRGKPVFINIRTVIGVGTRSAGTAKAYQGPIDEESVQKSKVEADLDPKKTHEVPVRALQYFIECKIRGKGVNAQWNAMIARYDQQHPELAQRFQRRREGGPGKAAFEVLDAIDITSMATLATRESNGLIMEKLWPVCESLCGGGADLVNSNKVYG